MNDPKYRLILASASPARLALLSKIVGQTPEVMIPDVNEEILPKELPRVYVERVALDKLFKILNQIDSGYVISADTAVVLGRSILPKATNDELVKSCLEKISGRRHRVYTSVCIAFKRENLQLLKKTCVAMSVVKFKCLTDKDINWYIKSGEGINKAGGYAVQGLAQCFIPFLRGSVSGIMGLPLLELKNMLLSIGYKIT